MALLTSIFRLVITLGAIGPTLSRQKLPTLRTIYALIVSRPAARFTTHVTSRAHSFIAVVPCGARGTTFSTLQLKKESVKYVIETVVDNLTCRPAMHSLQLVLETHLLQVCKQGSHRRDPLSWKKLLSQTATHRVPWRIRGLAQERQACSVGPSQDSQVEWQGLHKPPSKY
jgi:hypothetical protein